MAKIFKVAIGAGHYPGDKNQARNETYGLSEHWQCRKIVRWLNLLLTRDKRYLSYLFYGRLPEKIRKINYFNPDIVLELHMNASPESWKRKGRGTEILYHPDSSQGRRLASLLLDSICGLGFVRRGVKEGYYRLDRRRGILPLLGRTKAPAVIIEYLFLDNDEETSFLMSSSSHRELAQATYLGIRAFFSLP